MAPKARRRVPDGSLLERTNGGPDVAEVQSVNNSAATEEQRAFMLAIVAGLADLEAGRELPLAEAKARFGLK